MRRDERPHRSVAGGSPGKVAKPFTVCRVCSERGAPSPQARPRGDRKRQLPAPGTATPSPLSRAPGPSALPALCPGRACLVTPAGLSASPGRGLNVHRASDIPGGSLTQASSETLLRAPFPWELREEEGSGWSQRPCRPEGTFPRAPLLPPILTGPLLTEEGLTSGLTGAWKTGAAGRGLAPGGVGALGGLAEQPRSKSPGSSCRRRPGRHGKDPSMPGWSLSVGHRG